MRRFGMKFLNHIVFLETFLLLMLVATPGLAQTQTQTTEKKAAASPEADAQEKNLQAYIDLLRTNVRQQKAEIMGAVMLLSPDDGREGERIDSEIVGLSKAAFRAFCKNL